VPLIIGVYFAPESPWNSVRRGKLEEARNSLIALRKKSETNDTDIDATLAYIRHTTALEKAETSGASFLECFRGTNLRRTEIVSGTGAAATTSPIRRS
jgi:SP family general alpha glucoside:H+ symporter-like MFS transporter